MINAPHHMTQARPQRGFTLMELLIVMLIIAVMAGLSVAALSGTQELAREQRTRAIVNKCDMLIMEKYEAYRTRRLPIRIGPNTNSRLAARYRLDSVRELMRMELPCCRNDVLQDPNYVAIPAVTRSYRRRVPASWNDTNVEAECLYLIISGVRDGDKNAIDFFAPSEVRDTDEDGVPEILDAWGRPLVFFRWAPGYTEQVGPDGQWGVAGTDDDGDGATDNITEAGWPGTDDYVPLTQQTRIASRSPDPFDPLRVDPRNDNTRFPDSSSTHGLPYHSAPNDFTQGYPLNGDSSDDTFYLKPFICSMGRNKELGMALPDGTINYGGTLVAGRVPNDPYIVFSTPGVWLGTVTDSVAAADNITNHFIEP